VSAIQRPAASLYKGREASPDSTTEGEFLYSLACDDSDQFAGFIAVGRLFDTDSPYNVRTALRASQSYP
jgi:hypothetical protein